MAPKKNVNKRQTQENERSTPAPEENPDGIFGFVKSLPADHQEDVQAIIDMTALPIDTKLVYLEEHLTVAQLRTCRRLLEEECSNFKQFLTKPELKVVEKMIPKKDFDSIRKTISGNVAALEAFRNYLKYNGYENDDAEAEEEPEEEDIKKSKKGKADAKKGAKGTKKVQSSDEEESDEEEDSESEDVSEEEEPTPKPTKKNKDKKGKDFAPNNMDYEAWKRHCESSTACGQSVPTPVTIWQMAEKAANEINELGGKVSTLEMENERLKRELQGVEQLRKSERDELNRYNEQKLQEASKNYLEELKQQEQRLKDQHARELAAAYVAAGQNPDD